MFIAVLKFAVPYKKKRAEGSCQVKNPKIREHLGSWLVGQAPVRIFFVCVFCVFFCTCLKKITGGWVGGIWPRNLFLGCLEFNLTRPLEKVRTAN